MYCACPDHNSTCPKKNDKTNDRKRLDDKRDTMLLQLCYTAGLTWKLMAALLVTKSNTQRTQNDILFYFL